MLSTQKILFFAKINTKNIVLINTKKHIIYIIIYKLWKTSTHFLYFFYFFVLIVENFNNILCVVLFFRPKKQSKNAFLGAKRQITRKFPKVFSEPPFLRSMDHFFNSWNILNYLFPGNFHWFFLFATSSIQNLFWI